MAHLAGTDRSQSVLLPEVLDDYVRPDNPVRFLDAFVAQLDLSALGFQRVVPAETGRPGYDPGDLLRLYLYGYLHRIRSSRRLEQETHRNVELMWLLRRLTPDFKTIADFRRDHPAALKGVCREFLLLCKRLDLFGGELLAIDGSKFRAVNARDRSYTAPRLAELTRQIDRTIAGYLRELERQDQVEAGIEGPSAEALQGHIAALQQRRARYATLQQELAASGATALSLTLTSANEALGLFTKDDFVYDPAQDVYRCPAGETLTYRTTTVELGRSIKNYRTRACGRCALKPRCTRNQDGRKLTRWVHEHLLEYMATQLRRAPALFAQRKALAEHPFGTMKRGMDQGYFLLKGLAKVRGEFSLTVLAYNLKRVFNVVGVPRLLAALV